MPRVLVVIVTTLALLGCVAGATQIRPPVDPAS